MPVTQAPRARATRAVLTPTEPLAEATFKLPATAQYSEAFARFEAGDATAMPAFAALVGAHASDTLAGFHLRRLLNVEPTKETRAFRERILEGKVR